MRVVRGTTAQRLLAWLLGIVVVLPLISCARHPEQSQAEVLMELRLLSLRLPTYAVEAGNAKVEAFSMLKGAAEEFLEIMRGLKTGDTQIGLRPLPQECSAEVAALEVRWNKYKKHITAILEAEGTIRILKEFQRAVHEVGPELIASSFKVSSQLSEKKIPAKMMFHAGKQVLLLQRMTANVDRIMQPGDTAAMAIDQFRRDLNHFVEIHQAMISGNKELGIGKVSDPAIRLEMKKTEELFRNLKELVDKVIEKQPQLAQSQQAVQEILKLHDGLHADVNLLYERLRYIRQARSF